MASAASHAAGVRPPLGIEVYFALWLLVFYVLPLLALGCALITLARLRDGQRAMQSTLAAIERKLRLDSAEQRALQAVLDARFSEETHATEAPHSM